MQLQQLSNTLVEQQAIASEYLKRYVIIDCYLPLNYNTLASPAVLLLNDGQDLEEMPFAPMLNTAFAENLICPLICVGIHAGKDRRNEYGTAGQPDYAGRGAKAGLYQQFLVEELLPFLAQRYAPKGFGAKAAAGFSLGGLQALDTVWTHPELFTIAGVFSGSLWWRSRDLGEGYDDHQHRIMHQKIRGGAHHAGLRFYFTTGSLDEAADRNNNGIIDSIDDTEDLIKELRNNGYSNRDIRYINFEDGRHDVATWARALPQFLQWGWPAKSLVF